MDGVGVLKLFSALNAELVAGHIGDMLLRPAHPGLCSA